MPNSVGAELVYINDESVRPKVVDDRKIEYQGEILYMTTLVKRLTGKTNSIAGPQFFTYDGIPLQDYYNKY